MKKFTLILVVALAACSDPGTGISTGGTFVVAVGPEQFRVRIDNSLLASQARRMMNRNESQQIIIGPLERGDGGFNTGYHWHIRSTAVSFGEDAPDSCNALPSEVEANVDHWVDTVKQYCPRTGHFVSEVGRF